MDIDIDGHACPVYGLGRWEVKSDQLATGRRNHLLRLYILLNVPIGLLESLTGLHVVL